MKIEWLRKLTLLEISERMARGEISSLELVSKVLEEIRRTEKKIKAYVTVCDKEAINLAKDTDGRIKKRKKKENGRALEGIPLSFKDNIETKGIRTTCSSKILRNYVPQKDATVVARLKNAGCIVLGKLNLHEFAQGGLTPPTRNPWNLGHIAGGSSGGSGAAVAAASAVAALGSDTGGSIRTPAAFCGIAGMKPSYGLVSRYGLFPNSWSLDHVGPMCRRVEDVALLLTLIEGRDPQDPTTSYSRAVSNYVEAINEKDKGLRIGVPKNHFFSEQIDERIAKTVMQGIDDLAGEVKCNIVEFHFPDPDKMLLARLAIDYCESSAVHSRWIISPSEEKKYRPDVRLALKIGARIPALYYIQAMRYRDIAFEQVSPLFKKKFDVMITPMVGILAPKIGEKTNDDLFMYCGGMFNLLGLPALSVPCGFVDGLPVGMQIVGNLFDDASVLSVGKAFEGISRCYLETPSIS